MSASQTPSANPPSNDDLRAQLEQTRKDMRILAGMAGKRAANAGQEVRGAASNAVDELSEEASRLFSEAKAAGEHLYDRAEETARRHPLAVTGAAFAIGWMIGSALRK